MQIIVGTGLIVMAIMWAGWYVGECIKEVARDVFGPTYTTTGASSEWGENVE